jgi:hypothetical protein
MVKYAAAMIVAFRHQGLAKDTVDAERDRYRRGQSIDYAAEALEKEKTEGVIISSSHFEGNAAGYFTWFKLRNAVPWEAKTLQQRFDSLFSASKKAAAVEQSPGTLQQCMDSLDKRLGTYNRGNDQGTVHSSRNTMLTIRLQEDSSGHSLASVSPSSFRATLHPTIGCVLEQT